MQQESSSAVRANPSLGAVRAAVRSLLPTIRSRAMACERARSVPDETVEELRQAGLYKLVQPAAYGGYEQDFVVLADLMMEMAGACASTAWVCGLLSAHQWLVGLFPAEAQSDVWGSNPGATFCGSYAPINEAAVASGGFRLNGRWSFASGCDNAQWAICAARLPAAAQRPTQPAFLLVPASDYAIDDTWDVIGLAGTGSKTSRSRRRVCARAPGGVVCGCRRGPDPGQPALSKPRLCRSGLQPCLRVPRRNGGGGRGRRDRGFRRRHRRASDARLGNRRQQPHGRIPDNSNSDRGSRSLRGCRSDNPASRPRGHHARGAGEWGRFGSATDRR